MMISPRPAREASSELVMLRAFLASCSTFTKATQEVSSYQTPVSNLMKAIAAVIVLVGAFNVYFKMQNGDQDVKKTIMLTILTYIVTSPAAAITSMAINPASFPNAMENTMNPTKDKLSLRP